MFDLPNPTKSSNTYRLPRLGSETLCKFLAIKFRQNRIKPIKYVFPQNKTNEALNICPKPLYKYVHTIHVCAYIQRILTLYYVLSHTCICMSLNNDFTNANLNTRYVNIYLQI